MRQVSRLSVFLLAASVALLWTAMASAQPPKEGGQRGRGMRGMMGGGGGLMLLQNEQVQKELDLVDDQKTKLRSLGEEMMKQFGALRDVPEADRQQKATALREETTKKVDEILLPHQSERLKQLTLQFSMRFGARALNEAKLQETLGLSDDQKQKIKDISDKADESRRASFQGGNRGQMSEEQRTKMTQIGKDSLDQAMAVLTSQQKEKLEQMQGKKIDIQFQFPRRPGGGPPPKQ
jgi:Spy/CpxP family protein refolding chaperone